MAQLRQFASRRRQRHLPGRWWSVTEGHHVGYESWLAGDHVMLLDFDPAVVGIASQPFWLSWTDQDGTVRSHAPDCFARRADGSAVVVDCRQIERRKPRDVAAFEATRRACGLLGWEYRLVGAAEAVLVRNVRWLAGYRHSRYSAPGSSEPSLEAPGGVCRAWPADGRGGVGRGSDRRAAGALYHLLSRGRPVTDLSVPLHEASMVARGPVV